MRFLKNKFFIIVIFVFSIAGIDQLTKSYILSLSHSHQLPIHVTSFFSIRLVWNKGISFGLLNTVGSTPWWLYIILGVVFGIVIAWMWRQRSSNLVWPLSAILGGAVGNIIDRVRYGAVVDFLDFFLSSTPWGRVHWPAFNVADMCITLGAIWLIYRLYKK